MVADLIAVVLAAVGTGLVLVAGAGMVRMPDLLTRMHASSKAGTLGAALILAAVGVHFGRMDIVAWVVVIILFLYLTAPLSAHMIARAGYRRGTPLCDETAVDEYREATGCAEPPR